MVKTHFDENKYANSERIFIHTEAHNSQKTPLPINPEYTLEYIFYLQVHIKISSVFYKLLQIDFENMKKNTFNITQKETSLISCNDTHKKTAVNFEYCMP